jgi:hypothetical protein
MAESLISRSSGRIPAAEDAGGVDYGFQESCDANEASAHLRLYAVSVVGRKRWRHRVMLWGQGSGSSGARSAGARR